MSGEIDFTFITEVGNTVKNIYEAEQNNMEWFYDIIDQSNESYEFPEGTLDQVIDYLLSFNNEEYTKTANQLINIQTEDGEDNILSAIFFGADEPPETATTATPTIKIDGDDDLEIDESNPKDYFHKKIMQVKNTLSISDDLAYLLLKKYNFNIDLAQQQWLTSGENILKSLSIKIGSPNIPSIKSSISFQNIGIGECPVCYYENEIYELYCGHKYCNECLFTQIKSQVEELKPPVCPDCRAEILSHDVLVILKDHPNLVNKYYQAVTKSEIELDNEIRPCLCCDSIITPLDKISVLFGRCAKCKFATCLNCKQGFHAPLTCTRMNNFFGDLKDSMQQLEEDQESWYFRERRLQAYRREHKEPVFKYFEQRMQEVLFKNRKAENEEKAKLSENQFFIKSKSQELRTLQSKSQSLLKIGKPENIKEIDVQIEKVTAEIENKKYVDQQNKEAFEKNKEERKKDVLDADTEKEYLINAISNETKFDYFLDEYKRLLNSEAYQSLNVTLTDEETIKRLTKLCPHCGAPIEKSQGCNWMKCICGFEFCYFCNQPWKPTHSDHHKCPKYDLMSEKRKGKSQCGINFEDMNDKKFYPPPMTAEKRTDFIRYSNLSMQYMNSKEKLEKLEDELRKTSNEDPNKSISDLDYDQLTSKNKLIKCLMKGNSEKVSQSIAQKIINTIFFAQKIVMYGFPQMYYIMSQSGIGNSSLFEYRLYKLEGQVDQLMEKIRDPKNVNYTEFEKIACTIDSDAQIIIDEGEKF